MTDYINYTNSDLSQDEDEEGITEDKEIYSDKIYNYKGYFSDKADGEEEEIKYYEHGAHFPYSFLFQKVEILYQEQQMHEYNTYKKSNANKRREEEKLDDNNILHEFNQNGRSRNHNCNNATVKGKRNVEDKVKTQNALVHIPNLNNQIETKVEMNKAVLPKTKTDYKSILYSIVGSRLKMNKYLNFDKKKISKEDNQVIMKTVQYENNKSKNKELINSIYNNRKAESKELSILSKDTSTNINKNTKGIKSNKNINDKNIPRTLINIIANSKTKQQLYYSPSTKNQKAKELKAQVKRVLASQYKIQNPKGFKSNNNMKQLTISLEKKKKKQRKIEYPYNIFNDKNSRSQTHSDNKEYNTHQNKNQIFNLRLKNIQHIIESISKTNNHISRNPQFNITSISKSKTSNQYEIGNNLTQENIYALQNCLINNDISKKLNTNLLQTTNNILNRSILKAKAVHIDSNKNNTTCEIRHSLNPKIKADLINKIDKSIGISSILFKTKAKLKVNNINKNTQNNNKKVKKIDFNTMSKGSTNLPGSTSSITTDKHSTSQKGSNVTNSKTSLVSNNVIKSYLNSFNKCNKSPKY